MKHIDEWWTKRLPGYALEEASKRIQDAVEKACTERATGITISDDTWKPASDDGSVLHASIYVNGCGMHLEAHAVKLDEQGCQAADGDSSYDDLASAFDINGSHQEVTINGRQYVLFACAYGD